MNCYDLAALCQILVSLGIDTQREKLRMKYMEPFGFIHATYLTGRFEDPDHPNVGNPKSLCNNPFFGHPSKDQEVLCKPDSDARSYFGNHMFLTLGPRFSEPYVFDACCGPQLGTITLSDYPSSAIDPSVALYGKTGQPSHSGNVRDIFDGPGVENLIICRNFAKFPGSSEHEVSTLLDLVATNLQHHGVWEEEYLVTPANDCSISARWLLRTHAELAEPHPVSRWWVALIAVTVFKYSNIVALQTDFNVRLPRSAGWIDSPDGSMQRCIRAGWIKSPDGSMQRCFRYGDGIGSRAFKNEKALYSAIIETTDALDEKGFLSESLKVDLEKVLKDILTQPGSGEPWPAMKIIERPPHDLEVHPSDMPQPVGSRIVVGVKVGGATS